MLAKSVSRESRAILYGGFSVFGDLGVLLVNLVGGHLYDDVSHLWPFGLGLITQGILLIFTIIFAAMKQLKV